MVVNPDSQPIEAAESEQSAEEHNDTLDGMTGRISALNLGDKDQRAALFSAMSNALETSLGAPSIGHAASDAFHTDTLLSEGFEAWIKASGFSAGDVIVCEDSLSVMLLPSPDQAVEAAVCFARRSGGSDSFKIVSLIGSDHGRTAACRTASGIPELHDGYGPLVPGFTHIPPDNIDALNVAVDESTAAVLLAPIDFGEGAVPLSTEFLLAARERCDQHDALLIIDEQAICIGSCGTPFAHSMISDGQVRADAVITSAGLFAGQVGAAIVAGSKFAAEKNERTLDSTLSIARAAAVETLAQMTTKKVVQKAEKLGPAFAKRIAEAVGDFSFVRDLSVCGLTLGIQSDLPSEEIVEMAAKNELRLFPAGETAVFIQPTPSLCESDQSTLIERLSNTMKAMESRTATAMVGQTESEADDSKEEENE